MPILTSVLDVLAGPGPRIADVGPLYDLLLTTRDGATLPCKNKDGQVVNIAKLAFVTSIDPQNQQHEETELQHKDQLVQLASPNLIDREFDQWPQVSQGDWSGGTLQRVFTGATPVSGGIESDPTRYWEGDGVLWPINDYLPQSGAQFTQIRDQGGTAMKSVFTGSPAGGINSIGMSYAFLYTTTTGTIATNLVIINNDTKYTIVNPAGIATGSGTPSAPTPPNDMFIGAGVLWYTVVNGGNVEIRFVTVGGPTITLFDTIVGASFIGAGNSSIGYVGNKTYLAIPYLNNTTPTERIRLYEIENGISTSSVDLNLGDTTTVLGSSGQINVASTTFVNDSLYYSCTNFSGDAFICSYSLASTTFSTVSYLPGEGALFMTAVAGVIFIVSDSGNMYLLQGGALQHIGPLPTEIGPLTVSPGVQNAVHLGASALSRVVAFSPYAIFAASYYPQSTPPSVIALYAYDVLRGRLFRIGVVSNLSGDQVLNGQRLGLMTGGFRTLPPSTVIQPQWSVVVPTLGSGGTAGDVANVQIFDVGVRRQTQKKSQFGILVISSTIDFTNAQPKLFRDILAKFLPLSASSSCGVQLNVWLDQDPANLSIIPDFTTSVFGNASPGVEQLVLRINTIATKLVYRVTTFGGTALDASGNIIDAPKLISVIIRAATGWTRTVILNLGDNAIVNGKGPGDTPWVRQSTPGQPAVDATVAYNFLRQLWRLRGGECVAVFPNQDPPANWLLQDLHFDSPKPFGVSFRGDQKSSLGYISTVKMREDV